MGCSCPGMETARAIVKWITKHRWLSITGALAILAIGGFVRFVVIRSDGTLSAPLQRGGIVDAIYGIGTVTATRSYAIKPGVITTIRNLYVKEGDYVHKGGKLANIDNVVYSAPFDGVVNYLPFKVGENVFAQLPIAVVTDLLNRYLVVSLEQQGALRIKAGQKTKLSFDSIRQQTFDGVVESVYSYNGSFLARIDVSTLPSEFLPDMTADVALHLQADDRELMPVAALENDSVWVKRGFMIPEKVAIKLGVVDSSMAEVVSGDLRPGDRVLIHRKVGP